MSSILTNQMVMLFNRIATHGWWSISFPI